MQKNNIFFFVLIIGMLCVQKVCAMELVKPHEKKNDVAINMHDLWSDDYIKDVGSTKSLDLKNIRSDLKKDQFLSVHFHTLHHLLYLSTIRKNDNRTLFTQKQQNKFDTAENIKRSVPWTFGVNGAVIGGTSLFSFTNFAGLAQLSQVVTITIPTIVSVVGNWTVGFVSLYATGLLPDLSSRKADKVQDEIGHLGRTYATIAKYLIDIYFEHQQEAKWIVSKLDIDELTLRAQEKTHKKRAGESLINPLQESCHFVKYGKVLPTFTEIENYLYTKIHSRHIESLEKRIDLLEKVIQEKDAKIEKLNQEHI